MLANVRSNLICITYANECSVEVLGLGFDCVFGDLVLCVCVLHGGGICFGCILFMHVHCILMWFHLFVFICLYARDWFGFPLLLDLGEMAGSFTSMPSSSSSGTFFFAAHVRQLMAPKRAGTPGGMNLSDEQVQEMRKWTDENIQQFKALTADQKKDLTREEVQQWRQVVQLWLQLRKLTLEPGQIHEQLATKHAGVPAKSMPGKRPGVPAKSMPGKRSTVGSMSSFEHWMNNGLEEKEDEQGRGGDSVGSRSTTPILRGQNTRQ